MKAIDRLYIYLEYQKVKPTVFEREIGLSSGYLSNMKKRSADVGESILKKVIENCHFLSLEWLLTGKEPMLKGAVVSESEPQNTIANAELLDRIERLSAEKARLEVQIDQLLAEKKIKKPVAYSVAAEPELKLKKE